MLSLDPAGTPVCGGGLAVTTRDLARFGLVLAEGGRRGDDQNVPIEVIETIRAGGDPDVFQAGGTYDYLAGYSYRDQWWMPGGSRIGPCRPGASMARCCGSIPMPSWWWPATRGGPDPSDQRRDLEQDAMCRALTAASPNWG